MSCASESTLAAQLTLPRSRSSTSQGAGALLQRLTASERVVAGLTTLLMFAIAIGHARVIGWEWLLIVDASALAGMWMLANLSKTSTAWSIVRDCYPAVFYLLWFEQSGRLAHLLVAHWQDAMVIAADHRLLGVDPTVWVERYINYRLTELMEFGYFSYYFYLPIVAGILLWQRRWDSFRFTVYAGTLAYALCNLMYLLLPVEGPFHTFRAAQHVALRGGFFAACVNFLEHYGRVHGSAFPSAHVAGAVVAAFCAWRYLPRLAVSLAPFVALMCAGTVYLRFHYFSDVLGGVVVAIVAFLLARLTWARATDRIRLYRPAGVIAGCILALFCMTRTADASTPPVIAGDELFESTIQRGLALMYDGKVEAAQQTFHELGQLRPQYPAGDVYQTLVDWWRAVGDPGNDALARAFSHDAEQSIQSCRRWLRDHPSDAEGWLYLASVYGARARFAVSVRPSSWRALQDGLEAHRDVLRAQALDPRNPDLGLGLGAYEYFAATLPAPIRPFAWLLGARGNREHGLAQLEHTAQQGRHARTEALLVIASAYWSERDYMQFERTLARITSKSTNNPVLLGWQVSGWVRQRNWNAAESVIAAAEQHRAADPSWIAFQRGRIALARGNWADADASFSRVLADAGANMSLRAWAHAGRARALHQMGQNASNENAEARGIAPAAMVFADQVLGN